MKIFLSKPFIVMAMAINATTACWYLLYGNAIRGLISAMLSLLVVVAYDLAHGGRGSAGEASGSSKGTAQQA